MHRLRHPDAILLEDDATPAQEREHYRGQDMRDRLYDLALRLSRKRSHTMPELGALAIAAAWAHGSGSELEDGGGLIAALVRGLTGIDPRTVMRGDIGELAA
ncbi:MAG TPA: hypothetical protein VGF29_16790 [Hyphomicrobiaceae bacterium]|jgi:hypothetical protein